MSWFYFGTHWDLLCAQSKCRIYVLGPQFCCFFIFLLIFTANQHAQDSILTTISLFRLEPGSHWVKTISLQFLRNFYSTFTQRYRRHFSLSSSVSQLKTSGKSDMTPEVPLTALKTVKAICYSTEQRQPISNKKCFSALCCASVTRGFCCVWSGGGVTWRNASIKFWWGGQLHQVKSA